jgi:hypothetical protein
MRHMVEVNIGVWCMSTIRHPRLRSVTVFQVKRFLLLS